MKFGAVFRFELAYQLRRPWPWLCMAVLIVFAFFSTRIAIVPVTLPQDFILNSPFIITSVTVFSTQIWLLIAPAIAGEAAARDVHTRMDPLLYASPISKAEYLGGRYLAAVVLNAMILSGVQIGSLLAAFGPGANPEIIGPFLPTAYLTAFVFIGLSNALVATAFQFAASLATGRPMASYAGSLGLFFLSYPVTFTLYMSGLGERALLADPIGVMAIMNEMMSNWTIVEKNVRMFALEGAMLTNRLLWIGVALVLLTFIYVRFRFAHRTGNDLLNRLRRRLSRRATLSGGKGEVLDNAGARGALSVPHVRQAFGLGVMLRQTLAIARSSFGMIVKSPAGLFMMIGYPMFAVVALLGETEQWGVPLVPRTGYIVSKFLAAPLTLLSDFRVMIPLLIVYFAGELIWRERDARLSETVDAAPVPEWVLFLGKYLGLGLVLLVFLGSLTLAGMFTQTLRGVDDYQVGQYVQMLVGFQLIEYLLFAALAFVIQAVVNQKYVGLLLTLVAYFLIVFSSFLGIHHKLLVYSASPAWSYTDMRGFGDSVGPWLWFKLYWVGWALLLAVVTRLMWTRGRDDAFRVRVRGSTRRFRRGTAATAAMAVAIILGFGGFVFYNTNVLNEYITDDEMEIRRVEYERLYGEYEGKPQPVRAHTSLHIDIHPTRNEATIRGSYRLVNREAMAIDSVHLEPAFYVDTDMRFDRPAHIVVYDRRLGHVIYALDEPLQPGDSMTLDFELRYKPRGFGNSGPRSSGAGTGVFENGSNFTSGALPVIGYQPMRELWSAADRSKHGLPRQLTLSIPGDIDASLAAVPAATFDAIIGTDAGQVAVAPGELRRTWSEDGRSYFHYVSDVPINGTEVFFSADYKVHREHWNGIDLQVYLHPAHAGQLERFLRGARAALDYYSAQFGPYPYRFLQVIEQPGNFLGMGVDGSGVITGGEGIFQLVPPDHGLDMIYEVMAHEIGHQWWGMQLKPAWAEGGGVISEGLAWYSTMQLVKKVRGREELRQLMARMREPNPWPAIRTGMPLLRAIDPWANYRKGPYATYALSEYIGEDRVNAALRALVEKKAGSLATTLDMYREFQTVTPDSLKPLLHDLFEVNAFWTFDTKRATAKQAGNGSWQVTMEVTAQKLVSDSTGREVDTPIGEPIEIGVFAAAQPGQFLGELIYLEKHRIRSGPQTLTFTVPERPSRGGIDPYNLLDWEEGDNIEGVQIDE